MVLKPNNEDFNEFKMGDCIPYIYNKDIKKTWLVQKQINLDGQNMKTS